MSKDMQMDSDLDAMARDQLIEEVKKLRSGIREHRDSTGHELCWHHPRLWGLLPDKTDPLPVVPAWPEFMRGCLRYRQSLDEQAPEQPRSVESFEDETDSNTTVASILWRRLDTCGHDACRLELVATGWRLTGTAVFQHGETPARLDYSVACDSGWSPRRGRVRGWFGDSAVDYTVLRTIDGGWLLNSLPVSGLEGCADLDFDFTPATNLIHLRRWAMADDEKVQIPAALLRLPAGKLSRIDQSYQRRGPNVYWYAAPDFGYQGQLHVDASGFVTRYPDLWEAESGTVGGR